MTSPASRRARLSGSKQVSELFREIEEDIRRERYDRLWNSFGKVMVGVSLMVILVTIAVVIWQNHRQSTAMEKTGEFIKGIDRLNIEDYKGAIPIFDKLSADTGSTYYGLSLMRKAQAQNALSDHDGAYTTYKTLAEHDPVFGELAKLKLPATQGDVTKPRLGAPFFYAQSEARAWQLLKAGKKDNAVAQFLSLYRDKETPYSMHARVVEALQYLAPERLQEKETTHDTTDAKGAEGE